jgi:hypothetical protein
MVCVGSGCSVVPGGSPLEKVVTVLGESKDSLGGLRVASADGVESNPDGGKGRLFKQSSVNIALPKMDSDNIILRDTNAIKRGAVVSNGSVGYRSA